MTFAEIEALFTKSDSWEQRYRQLILLGKQLPKPDIQILEQIPLVEGCESRLWFKIDYQQQQWHIIAYSDARILNGILFILITALSEQTTEQLAHFQITPLLQQLKIDQRLSETRLNGLKNIEKIISKTVTELL
ncbi:SufE family protein [Gallibacterium genomosp. 3]|uniref:Cysteine desufuration protein SufE n=1 Tax=Gallibacterium genomosp. 3 TaxID=505345 RepID=A0A1A7QBF1_9PAST|nr:SufE family protein [Gallibacterium genomosp. 3]OBX12213.1 cysteine desufuration protein SufE [Gallibacterium genomosp. 3]